MNRSYEPDADRWLEWDGWHNIDRVDRLWRNYHQAEQDGCEYEWLVLHADDPDLPASLHTALQRMRLQRPASKTA